MQAAMQYRGGRGTAQRKRSKQRTSWRKKNCWKSFNERQHKSAERLGGASRRNSQHEYPYSLLRTLPLHSSTKPKHTPWLLMRAVVAAVAVAALSPHSMAFTFLAQYNKIDSQHASLSTTSTLAASASSPGTYLVLLLLLLLLLAALLVSFNSMALIHSFIQRFATRRWSSNWRIISCMLLVRFPDNVAYE